MSSALITLVTSHAPAFVIGAACICLLTAWLVLLLLDRARTSEGEQRRRWMAAVSLVGGAGIWATHFVAMLGFRPDILFGYDASITATSALIAIALIGVPLSLTALTQARRIQALCGAIAGAGVAAMHFTGMLALRGCGVSHSSALAWISTLLGIGVLAGALVVGGRGARKRQTIVLIVLAVCLVHFMDMAGVSLTSLSQLGPTGVDPETLAAIVSVISVSLLVTAAKATVSSAKLEEKTRHGALLAAALNNMSNGLLVIDEDGRITLLNDRLLSLFDIDERHVAVGMHWQEHLKRTAPRLGWDADFLARVVRNYELWLAAPETTHVEHMLRDGRVIGFACRPTAGGGAVLTYDDVTAERNAQKTLESLAFVDPLTGLANRRAFQTELEEALRTGEDVALLFIDLDHFKTINDTLGHGVGDELLVKVGERLKAACGRHDVVARLGGDELAFISRGRDAAGTEALAERVVADIAAPFPILEHTITIGCSLGIATTADTRDAPTLIQYADIALFRAKALGRGQHRRYEAGMQEAERERSRLEADLRRALAKDEFKLVYQPLCRFPDLRIGGFEALIRWEHPERGRVPPDRFIPMAEETGVIREIGAWILAEACRQASNWPSDIHVAVNVSSVQLRDASFPLEVAQALAASGLAPKRLEIELTETALVTDGRQIAAGLQALRMLGIRVAMDDFGTGYSSFAHLTDFDLDRIKIDRSFVQAAPENRSAKAVVKAVIQMARDLGVETIGEGVETLEQLELLQRLGCDAAQGYLLGHPLSPREAEALIADEQDWRNGAPRERSAG